MIDVSRGNWPTDMRRAADTGHEGGGAIEATAERVVDSVRRFVHEKPEQAALWALGVGFVLGWKLKPW